MGIKYHLQQCLLDLHTCDINVTHTEGEDVDHPQSSLHLHPSVLGMICDFVERGEGGGSTAQDFPFKRGDIVVGDCGWWMVVKRQEDRIVLPDSPDY